MYRATFELLKKHIFSGLFGSPTGVERMRNNPHIGVESEVYIFGGSFGSAVDDKCALDEPNEPNEPATRFVDD